MYCEFVRHPVIANITLLCFGKSIQYVIVALTTVGANMQLIKSYVQVSFIFMINMVLLDVRAVVARSVMDDASQLACISL